MSNENNENKLNIDKKWIITGAVLIIAIVLLLIIYAIKF